MVMGTRSLMVTPMPNLGSWQAEGIQFDGPPDADVIRALYLVRSLFQISTGVPDLQTSLPVVSALSSSFCGDASTTALPRAYAFSPEP